ncbi:MAG: TRAP transporter substrate-binding protein DctP [Elusimicrobiales bacterium]|jgi:TRAP-type C4-dicarboxylate transport system substrate-binding protein
MNYFDFPPSARPSTGPLLYALLLSVCLAAGAGAQTVVKFATLAPEGTAWMKVMHQFNDEVSAKTAGRVKFKLYAGGVSGDEKDVARKIRLGQLQAAGFTGVGLGEIAPETRVLDTPFLFKTAAEIDNTYKMLDADFRRIFESKGYILLGWTEVGNVYIFSNTPVTNPADLQKVKMWIWEGDPIAEATFSAMKIKPIPLSITDVMTSLQTGMINAVYSAPATLIPLQWYTKMKYALAAPIATASGAVVISKKVFELMSKDDRKAVLEAGDKYFKALTAASRRDNERSILTLKKEHVVFSEPSGPETLAAFERMGEEARGALVGKLYTRELLEKIENALKQFRAKKK